MKKVAILVLCLCTLSFAAWAAERPAGYEMNWPQWRGPHGIGIAPHGDPPQEWSETKNVRWAALMQEALDSRETLLALEHLELVTAAPQGRLLLSHALDEGVGLIGTMLPAYLRALAPDPLARRVHVVELAEPTTADTIAILSAVRERIAPHHNVEVAEAHVPTCIRAAAPLPGTLPAKAIAVLDAAASRAALSGTKAVSADDIYFAASRGRMED